MVTEIYVHSSSVLGSLLPTTADVADTGSWVLDSFQFLGVGLRLVVPTVCLVATSAVDQEQMESRDRHCWQSDYPEVVEGRSLTGFVLM